MSVTDLEESADKAAAIATFSWFLVGSLLMDERTFEIFDVFCEDCVEDLVLGFLSLFFGMLLTVPEIIGFIIDFRYCRYRWLN